MRVAVISDVHLGRRQFRKLRDGINTVESEIYKQWFKSIETVIDKSPEILVISGDLFDKPNPSSLAMKKAIEGFKMLERTNIAVYVISGNHEFDNQNYINSSHPFEILDNIFPYMEFCYSGYRTIDMVDLQISLLPHQPLSFKDDLKIKNKSMSDIHSGLAKELSSEKKKVLITHGLIESWAKKYSNIDESMRISNMIISDQLVDMYDYTIIGHIHSHTVERGLKSIRVSPGSLIDERDSYDRGPTIIDLDNGNVEYIPLKSINTYKMKCETVESLVQALRSIEEDNIYILSYPGKWSDIPDGLYKDASNKALYLNIVNTEQKVVKTRNIRGFWEWISSNKEMEKEFREIIKNRK